MILATLLVAAFLPGPAQAEVKLPGTILTTECAQKIVAVGRAQFSERLPSSLCFAQVVGRSEAYLLMDATLWEVQKHKNGDLLLRKAGVSDSGRFVAREYSIGSAERNLYLDGTREGDIVKLYMDGQTIRAENFEAVFHTM